MKKDITIQLDKNITNTQEEVSAVCDKCKYLIPINLLKGSKGRRYCPFCRKDYKTIEKCKELLAHPLETYRYDATR